MLTGRAVSYTHLNERARISFYGDFLYPLASRSTFEQYLKEKPEGEFLSLIHILTADDVDLDKIRDAKWLHVSGFTLSTNQNLSLIHI